MTGNIRIHVENILRFKDGLESRCCYRQGLNVRQKDQNVKVRGIPIHYGSPWLLSF